MSQLLWFWDYDSQWGADRSRAGGGPQNWGFDEICNSDRLLELHEQYQIPSCFAVVGAAALPGSPPYHAPDQIRAIADAGHEIASHSMYHEWLPGLSREALRQTLIDSKLALENCIDKEVTTFVPPYNQPVDFLPGLAISFSERREAQHPRTDFQQLCEVLFETGYKFCRTSFHPFYNQILRKMTGKRFDRIEKKFDVTGITCVRLNTAGGFDEPVQRFLENNCKEQGIIVVYGHPHSINNGRSQDIKHLVQLMKKVDLMRNQGLLTITLPSKLI